MIHNPNWPLNFEQNINVYLIISNLFIIRLLWKSYLWAAIFRNQKVNQINFNILLKRYKKVQELIIKKKSRLMEKRLILRKQKTLLLCNLKLAKDSNIWLLMMNFISLSIRDTVFLKVLLVTSKTPLNKEENYPWWIVPNYELIYFHFPCIIWFYKFDKLSYRKRIEKSYICEHSDSISRFVL